ncbi:Cullin repeat-like-containing domain protein [Talaromyces proteolyticus]|uniref:Cullin repeat-like-containing domain protein n=1 Tax=Talaromyces proteolyticus TaxID=1131652 RepID=A0AAD4Q4T1_9EURO|nr:Cullin repeat-like-containing domain protein [Talaromyces proteolyticus]KAH8703444.1 Cullin repeat-like-containing domain protein [Talaromyces proteolyticus]
MSPKYKKTTSIQPALSETQEADHSWLGPIWASVDRIMNEEQVDAKTYMESYTAIHEIVRCPSPSLSAPTLYKHFSDYLKKYLLSVQRRLKGATDEDVLILYVKEWDKYAKAARLNNNLFGFLNRHYVRRERDEGRKNIYIIGSLHLIRWKEDVINEIPEEVTREILKQLEKQRNGETIKQDVLERVIDSFISLGTDIIGNIEPNLDVYMKCFQEPVLATTGEYYIKEPHQLAGENIVVKYMRKAETRLEEVKNRAVVVADRN